MEVLKNTQYEDMRGFNYIPSYAMFLRDITEKFDEKVWEKELIYAEKLGANTLRVWFDIDSHMADPERFIAVFGKIVELIKKHGMRMMPVLYNCWVDLEHPFGALHPQDMYSGVRQRHYDYVKDVVASFKDEEAIVMWDMCNEPFSFSRTEDQIEKEMDFWLDLIDVFRKQRPSQPLTMGTHWIVSHTPEKMYDAMDVFSCHPYSGWDTDTYSETLAPHVAHANEKGKPLVCSEAFQGSLSDDTRSLCIERCKIGFKAAKIGYLAFQLMEGKMISARRDWTDKTCIEGDRGFYPFVLRYGSVRKGHSIL